MAMTEVPAYVTQAAAQHDLGPLVIWRKGSNPIMRFIGSAAVAVLGGALLYAALWVLPRVVEKGSAGLGALMVLAGIGVVAAAVLAVQGLLKGFTAHYVYERGAIQTRNRRVSVATWDQLDEIRRAVAVRIPPREHLYVRFFDGRRWEVETVTRRNNDLDQRLVSAFLDTAHRLGRPVTQPHATYKDEGIDPPRWLIGVVVVGGLVLTCVINAILRNLGLSSTLALAGGFIVVGLTAWVAGQAYRLLLVTGALFAGFGGLILIVVVHDLLPSVNRWVVAAAVLAVELLIVRVLLRVNAALMPRLGAAARCVYALTQRWRYRLRQEITLPGPATAGRLLSVPPSATTTIGRSVVTFTVNGQTVTVFDRVRRRPRSEDRPQTVWQVHLPAPATYRAYPDGSWVDGSTLWYAEESPMRTGISPKRIRAVAARLVGTVTQAASHR
ncbi:MAG: hypothetical protein IRY85_08365 [Micromonosporaceae bacterium]|nr:hypothetical protein [Micromonosporaceae bacterium]